MSAPTGDRPPTLMELVDAYGAACKRYGRSTSAMESDRHWLEAGRLRSEIERRIGELATQSVDTIQALADLAGLPRPNPPKD